MKYLLATILGCLFLTGCSSSSTHENASYIVTTDIDNFWKVYDKVSATQDSVKQLQYLNDEFIAKGSPGLKAIMQARRYTPQQYLKVIKDYPRFWKSIRANTQKAKGLSKELEQGIGGLKKLYPALKPAKIYFTVGALGTNGTTLDSLVLIGSELAMADKNTKTAEFPEMRQHLKTYFASNPIDDIVFLNIHEYVHTQQSNNLKAHLLSQCLREGIAEFIAEKVSGKPSSIPAMQYGKAHAQAVKVQFQKEMFNYSYHSWLWSNARNKFNVRDLGYYIGYTMADKYYQKNNDTLKAIKELIELNYQDAPSIEKFVDKIGYFSESIEEMKAKYEQNRPQIVGIKQFKNGQKDVSPGIRQITIEFSKKMDKRFRGFELGPLGKDHVLRVKKFIGFSEDAKLMMLEVALEPNKQYQVIVSNRFSSEDGTELKPYLIDITTAAK